MMVLITIQSGLSGADLQISLAKGLDKVIHFLIFGVLGWLMTRGFINAPGHFIPNHYKWFVITIALLFAITDEWHQSRIAGRYSDAWDWLADALGAIIFMWWYKKRMISRTHFKS